MLANICAIEFNCGRMNAMVENILQLSCCKEVIHQNVELREWLRAFVGEFISIRNLRLSQVELVVKSSSLVIGFDANQLDQVLSNLSENGIRHGGESGRIILTGGV